MVLNLDFIWSFFKQNLEVPIPVAASHIFSKSVENYQVHVTIDRYVLGQHDYHRERYHSIIGHTRHIEADINDAGDIKLTFNFDKATDAMLFKLSCNTEG